MEKINVEQLVNSLYFCYIPYTAKGRGYKKEPDGFASAYATCFLNLSPYTLIFNKGNSKEWRIPPYTFQGSIDPTGILTESWELDCIYPMEWKFSIKGCSEVIEVVSELMAHGGAIGRAKFVDIPVVGKKGYMLGIRLKEGTVSYLEWTS